MDAQLCEAHQRAEYWKSEHDKLRADLVAKTEECERLLAANKDCMAHFDQMQSDLAASQAECERLRGAAERGAYVVEHGGWIRSERDGCAYMTIKLPLDADLSCIATRRAAIDAARAGKGE